MQKIETILGGIAIILFGIASLMIFRQTNWGLFEVLGICCPVIGLAITIFGLVFEGENKRDLE